jgi:carboxylesterase
MSRSTKPRRRFLRLLLAGAGCAALAAAAVLLWLGRPLPPLPPPPAPRPAESYAEAMERAAALQSAEAALPLHGGGRTIILTHGHRTARVFVLLHGLTNAPRQFADLGEKLFAAGANVIIPRLAHHGMADRMTEAHGALTAADLVRYADQAVDLADGLGERVTVVGLSVSGISAGWLAFHRRDLDEAFILAPLFGLRGFPSWAMPPLTAALVRLPNRFLWWDPRARENLPGPPYNYPRFPTRGLGEALRLAQDVAAQPGPLAVRRLGIVLTEGDLAVDNRLTLRLAAKWREASPGTEFFIHEFPAAERIPHDFIDPLQPDARTEKVNDLLVGWLLGDAATPAPPRTAPSASPGA